MIIWQLLGSLVTKKTRMICVQVTRTPMCDGHDAVLRGLLTIYF